MHISSLLKLPPKRRSQAITALTEAEAEELLHSWQFQARANQLPPEWDWQVWLLLAGRGFGKTRTGAEWIRARVKAGERHIGLIGPTAGDVRDVMVEGPSGILAVSWEKDTDLWGRPVGRPVYEPSKRRLTWGNGASASTFSADEPERLRGPQHGTVWADELAAWRYAQETWDMAMFGLRLGADPRAMVTTTPRPIPLVRDLIKSPTTAITRGSTFENRANLAPSFLAKIVGRYQGTRLGRQELEAEILDDVPGALWSRDLIEKNRVQAAPEMARVVVAVDPSGTGGGEDEGDTIGIVVAGKGVDGKAYVLDDKSCKLSPAGWGRRVSEAYRAHKADRVVAEANFGGAMVEHVVRTADPTVAYKAVTASRGKVVRAEPVAALSEQGRIKFVSSFPELEDQLCAMTGDGYEGEGSPDRADALVWAVTELMLAREAPVAMWGRFQTRR